MPRLGGLLVVCIMFGMCAPPASAQEQPTRPSTPENDPHNPGLWNADLMMEHAVKQLARRYDLTPEQEEFTRKYLKKQVRAFLKDYEPELRALLVDAIELQRSPHSVNSQRMQEWAERALPVFNAAREAILNGNQEWGKILNENQKRMHQLDLDQMHVNFTMMDEKFSRWSHGGFKVEDLYPTPPRAAAPPGDDVDRSPAQVRGRGLSPEAAVSSPEDFWENMVYQLASAYGFTKEQKASAQGILQECRNKAATYRTSKRDQLDDLLKRIDALRAQADRRDELQKLQTDMDELLRPIRRDIFNELIQRVRALATSEQQAAYESKKKGRKDAIDENIERWQQTGRQLSQSQPATRPAASSPATPPPAVTPKPAPGTAE